MAAASLAATLCAAPLQAHHSISTIDIAIPVWVRGTVVQYDVVNPHVMLAIEAPGDDGRVARWTVEGPNLARLERYGYGSAFLKLGDVVEVCGFVPKPRPNGMYPPPRFVHGNMLVRPDGKLRWWGPYGKLDNCVRSGDRAESWVELLDTDSSLRDAWCSSYTAKVPLAASVPNELVGEINRRVAKPCP